MICGHGVHNSSLAEITRKNDGNDGLLKMYIADICEQ